MNVSKKSQVNSQVRYTRDTVIKVLKAIIQYLIEFKYISKIYFKPLFRLKLSGVCIRYDHEAYIF